MLQAKITKDYACAPQGHTVFRFLTGQIVTGRVAEMALADGCAEVLGPKPEQKISPPPEAKATPRKAR